LSRLEAATSRLEDIATSTELPKDLPALTETRNSPPNASTVSTPPVAPTKDATEVSQEPLPEAIEEFDNFLKTTVEKYVKLSDELGGAVAKQVCYIIPRFHIT
jgi:adenylyl cyclase-associated protein